MELHKPLKDQEIVCLAERMSPMEFDKIATDYLDLTKVCLHLLYSNRYAKISVADPRGHQGPRLLVRNL